ncbi:A24 family peptidase [Rhizobium sp. MHM7A]|uniref:prepilin peptidase n=1 Tax=Rhizobium sp. MHM7A TaxID=2583233 RepID=UPI001106E871|nr:A24 family peptidase [Rhizobium sp. MHM7A]TLX16906.1 prepilin peptidase [Rhizobium sp. MHM7A]
MDTISIMLLAIIVFMAGASIASFSGLVYFRLKTIPAEAGILKTISAPRSHCENCKETLRAVDLIPILGWVLTKGRCRHCHHPVPVRYPFTEALLGAVSVAFAWAFFPDIQTTILVLGLIWSLVVISAIDLSINIIPDELTTPLLFLGLLMSPFEASMELKVAGAAFGWFMLHMSMWVLQAWKGREGGNGGDAAMGALIGAWFGIFATPIYLFAFCVFYALHAGGLRKTREDGAPCGPAFSAAIIAVMPFHQFIGLIYGQVPQF